MALVHWLVKFWLISTLIGYCSGILFPPYNIDPLGGGGQPIKLFPGEAPSEKPADIRSENLVNADPTDPVAAQCAPGDVDGKWYYNVSVPQLVPFIVDKNHPSFNSHFQDTAIIIAPGGGFSFLAWHKEGTQIAAWINSLGISAFVLKYRVPSTSVFDTPASHMAALGMRKSGFRDPADQTPPVDPTDPNPPLESITNVSGKALVDGQRAVSLVRDLWHKYGFDSPKIGVMGFSAGGIMAAELSYNPERKYARQDQIDDVSHVPDFVMLIYGAGSPYAVKGVLPTQTFIAAAVDDQCVFSNLTEVYTMALETAGNHPEMHIFTEGRHGYGDCTMYTEKGLFYDVCSWTATAEVFLKRRIADIRKPIVPPKSTA